MIFVDVHGSSELYLAARTAIQQAVARVMHAAEDSVVVRCFPMESSDESIEIWVELSSEEQLYRHGANLARAITAAVQPVQRTDVWVMFRIVPLQRAFLNGVPRARGSSALE